MRVRTPQWQMQLGYNPVLGSKMLRRLAKKHKVSVAQVRAPCKYPRAWIGNTESR